MKVERKISLLMGIFVVIPIIILTKIIGFISLLFELISDAIVEIVQGLLWLQLKILLLVKRFIKCNQYLLNLAITLIK